MNSVNQVVDSPGIRAGLTVSYGIICAIEVNRFLSTISGKLPTELSGLHVVTFAGFSLVGWAFMKNLHRPSDRVAAFLYGLFYAIRVITKYVAVANVRLIQGIECGIISVGMLAAILGMVQAAKHRKSADSANGAQSS